MKIFGFFRSAPHARRDAVFLALDAALYLRHPKLILSFRRRVGYWPRPSCPVSYHEKYLWRKLFDHDPRFPQWTDKLQAKRLVRERFPDLAVAETLWEGDDPQAIPDALLQGDCVVKAAHGSGWNIIVRGGDVDRAHVLRESRKWLRRRYYGRSRAQWGYKHVTPRLLVEALVMDGDKPVDRDYKLYVAAGEVMYAYLKIDRFGDNPREAMLDIDGRSRRILIDRANMSVDIPKPVHWEAIKAAASRLGAEFDFVRVDLYETAGTVWFSELTFYSQSGYDCIDWQEMDDHMARSWDLRRSWFLRSPQKGWRGAYAARLKRALDRGALS
ncbi:ATP-grasp fold amidoligase family protein [Oricola sp.]|uniref:ATP-grasp fold amidoligase family protein n=1 Tax=Oricola sp. TaxID=1979950 RepID=UPI0025DF5FFA|nr:ATP-grasp fold amidoligase family protein [Oricola sp.]MCI5075735.1 hypothetical protein [Oricola sp.]